MPSDTLPSRVAISSVIAYLCDPKPIQTEQRIYSADTLTDLVEQTSSKWNHPLIEFYRQNCPHDTGRSATHLFLSRDSQNKDFQHADLAYNFSYSIAYDEVKKNIFDPRIKKTRKETGLKTELKDVVKQALPEGRLLYTMTYGTMGKASSEFIMPLVYQRLREAYMQDGILNLDDVFARVAKDVPVKLEEYAAFLHDDRIKDLSETFKEILESLTRREARVLSVRYGFEDGTYRSLSETGDFIRAVPGNDGATRGRMGQIEAKALRKLRKSGRFNKIKAKLEELELEFQA